MEQLVRLFASYLASHPTRCVTRCLGVLALTFVLSACTIRQAAPLPIRIHNVSLYSSIQDTSGRYIICDNLETRLVYSFDYSGYLGSWESALIGETTGEERGRVRLTPPRPESGVEVETVTLTYTLLPRSAPLSAKVAAGGALEPSSIIVEPISGQGTRIELTFHSLRGYSRTFRTRAIPVVSHC